MQTWIVLLRGTNVGGKNILPMKDLRTLLNELGFENISTYIQSGNCVFQSNQIDADKISSEIGNAIDRQFNFKPSVFTLRLDHLETTLEKNPYSSDNHDPKSVHFFFLSEPAIHADITALENLKKENEVFHLTNEVFYLFAPDGIGRSKLVEKIDKFISVDITARNLRSVMKILELAKQLEN